MSKIIVPSFTIKTGGSLKDLFFDHALVRSSVDKSELGEDSIAEGVFDLTITEVGNILAEGGNVEGYLMAIRAPIAILSTDVPDGLPSNKKFDGTAKKFEDWFNRGIELWEKNDNLEVIFFTSPFVGNENLYLKGSEIKIIHDLPGVTALTLSDADIETETGWTKL